MKRTAPPQTDYLEHDEIEALFKSLPRQGTLSLRDRAIFMVLYNTGARVQEIADLRIADVANPEVNVADDDFLPSIETEALRRTILLLAKRSVSQ